MFKERERAFDIKTVEWVKEEAVFWTIKLDTAWKTESIHDIFTLKLQSSSWANR